MERLRDREFAHASEHIAFDDAVHDIHTIEAGVLGLGGTKDGNARAQRAALAKMLLFLGQHLHH